MMPNSGVRYDSVYGVAGTPPSSVFIVYRNEKTYPKYLVRYKEIDQTNNDWTDEKTFFEVFSSVFNRNSMWAKKKPVPNVGDDSTPMAEVKKFYKYWDNFESWREFSQYDEYDLNEAADRY